MKSLIDYSLNEEYAKMKKLGDNLAKIEFPDRLGSIQAYHCWHVQK
jgi:hypothetical protein